MDVTQIPFVEHVGINKNAQDLLELSFDKRVENHLKTIHASAQFTLAETASGEILQQTFPQLANKVIPLLRESTLKFKKPAQQSVIAYPLIAPEVEQKFTDQFAKKGRASIAVEVEIRDVDGTITCSGTFNWFLQGI